MFKTCPICDAEFFTTRSDAIYCSAACRQRAWRSRRQASKDHKLVQLISKYPTMGRRIRTILRRYGTEAVYLTLSCLELVEES